jgi:hypothetical protein
MNQKLFNVSVILMSLGLSLSLFSMSLVFNPYLYPQDRVYFHLKAGSPDAYDNHIRNTTIFQYKGGFWTERGNTNYSTYAANENIEGLVNQSVRFDVYVYLNVSFANSSFDVEIDTKCLITISGEVESITMELIDVELIGLYWSAWYRYDWIEANKPEATTYDITIEYWVSGLGSTLGNPQDLDETDFTGSRTFGSANNMYEAYWTDDLDIYYLGSSGCEDYFSGGWGNWGGSANSYWSHAGFTPLDNIDEFCIILWVYLPENDTSTQVLFSQGSTTNSRIELYLTAGADLYFVAGNSSLYSAPRVYNLPEFDYYFIACSWVAGDQAKLYVISPSDFGESYNENMTTTQNTMLGTIDANTDFYIGTKQAASSETFDGIYFDFQIYDDNLTESQILEIYNGGEGYVISGNLNNSWTFQEHYFGYEITETVLHDGLGLLTVRETWHLDFASQTLSNFLWPDPYDTPYFYMFLVSIGLIPFSVFMMFRSVKTRKDEKFLFHMFIWAFMFVIAFTLMVTSIYGG